MGLLEDAIAQGNIDPSMSALFSPGMASGAANIVMNSPQPVERLSSINPSTGRPWGEYEAIYQNKDVAAMRERDSDRAKLLTVIGHLDPDLQPLMLRQFGFAPPRENMPPNVEGMTPTQAAATQQRYSEFGSSVGGGGEDSIMGAKLRRELQKIQFQHALNAPERDRAQALREFQAMASMENMRSQDLYRRDMINNRNEAIKNQKFGALQHIGQMITAMAGPGGNPELAKGLQQLASGIVTDLLHGDMAMGGGGPPETTISTPTAGNPNRTPLLSELMAQENAGQTNEPPWWDRVVPSSSAGNFVPDQKKIAALQAQLEHLAKFAPGDVGAQMAIKRQLQDALIPPAYAPPAAGSNISAPAGAVRKVR